MYIAFFCATHVALYDNIVDNLAMTWGGKIPLPWGTQVRAGETV